MAGTVVTLGALLRQRREPLPVGRIFDDAEHAAGPGRSKTERMIGDLGVAAVVGGGAARLPQLGDDRAARTAAVDVGRDAIHHEHRLAGGVVAGHHPADRLEHGCPSRTHRQPASVLALLINSNGPSSRTASSAKRVSARRSGGTSRSRMPSCLKKACMLKRLATLKVPFGLRACHCILSSKSRSLTILLATRLSITSARLGPR